MSPLQGASTVVVVLLAAGLAARRRPVVHRALMLAAFGADVALLVYIEATRRAVEAVVTGVPPIVWIHAAISLAVLAGYGLMLGLGRRLFAGARELRLTHRNVGIAFCVLRGLNYVTSLLVRSHAGA